MVQQARIIRYEFLPNQMHYMQDVDEVPFAAYIGGFGSGKTHVLVIQALREVRYPSYGLIGAPTYRMLADTTVRKFFQLCPPQWIVRFMKSENKVFLINGSEILFRSLDAPEKLTNLGIDWFGLDEIGEVKQDTFRMLQGRLRKPGGRHKGFGVGNPAGPTHWTYDYFVVKARDMPNRYRLTQATSYENTFLAKSYTDEMAASFGKESLYYKRFVMGEFVAFEGAYWAEFNLEAYPHGHICNLSDIKSILKPNVHWKYGRVVDFGFEHPFVLLWYVTDGNSIVFYDEYWQRHDTIQNHCIKVRHKELEHQFALGPHNLDSAWTDHDAQMRAEIEACKDESGESIGFSCQLAQKKVMEGILLVQTLISQKRLYISTRCEHSRIEIPSYRAKRESIKEEPVKENDDTCDAIRMACQMELAHTVNYVRAKEMGYETQETEQLIDQEMELHSTGDMAWQNHMI